MPDGTMMTEAHERLFAPLEFRDALVVYAREAIDRAFADVGELPLETQMRIRERFVVYALERLNQAAQAHELEIEEAEQRGRTQLIEQMARGTRIAAQAIAIARAPLPPPAPASSRHSMTELASFTAGAVMQLRKNIGIGVLAVVGMMRRREVPELEPRTASVYLSRALGEAAGDVMGGHLALGDPSDVRLASAMREAFTDGMNKTFGGVVDRMRAGTN